MNLNNYTLLFLRKRIPFSAGYTKNSTQRLLLSIKQRRKWLNTLCEKPKDFTRRSMPAKKMLDLSSLESLNL